MNFNFLRYLETGVYRGFIQVDIQYLKEKYAVHDVNIFTLELGIHAKIFSYMKPNHLKSNQVITSNF